MIARFEKRKKGMFSVSNFLGIIAFILILVIAGFLVFSNIKIKQQKDRIGAQIAAIEEQIGEIQSKNEELKEKISRVGEEDYIEKVLREELYQKEGERVIGFILPEEEQVNKGKSFWQPKNWWEFIKNILSKF